jgi:hypothetical protein
MTPSYTLHITRFAGRIAREIHGAAALSSKVRIVCDGQSLLYVSFTSPFSTDSSI